MARGNGIPLVSAWRYTANRRAFLLGLGAAGIGQLLRPSGAVARDATPTPGGEDETLLHATFAADELPTDGAECVFYRLTLEPGVVTSVLAGPYCGCPGQTVAPGVGAEVVVSGSYTIRSDGSVRLRRAGSSEEELANGTEAALAPGDVAVYLDYAAGGEFRNAGTDDLVVLGVAILVVGQPGGTPIPARPQGMRAQELSRAFPSIWEGLPDGPVTVDLRRLKLAPGDKVSFLTTTGLETASVEAGEIAWGEVPAGQEEPSSPPLRYRPGGRTPFVMRETGSRRIVENNGDEPASVLLLSIQPGDGLATPAAIV